MRRLSLPVVLLVLGLPAVTRAQSPIAMTRAPAPPTLADVAADRVPQAARLDDFRQREPGDLTPASQRTVAFVSYDSLNLYVGFLCRTAPGQRRAHLAKRENIADDDQVAVYLDTFGDHQRAYVFAVNPLGVQYDAVLLEGDDEDPSFDAVWHADGTLTPDGFAVLMTIPFRALRFSGGPHTWGLALGRVVPGRAERDFWPAITSRIEGFTNQMATVTLRDITSSVFADLIPYGAFTGARVLDESLPDLVSSADGRAGLDARVVLHDRTAIAVTANPDFSEVESNEPQVTINRRFEVYFPERRPFFIESADYFSTPDQLFYSRRVFDPAVGGRVTTAGHGWTFGALAVRDRAVASGDSDDSPSLVSVARLQRSIGEHSRVAVLTTTRHQATGDNAVVSVDARLKLSPTWVFTGQAARSRTTGATTTSGADVYAEISRSGRAFTYTGSYLDRGAAFDPQLGYVDRVDIRQTEHEAGYLFHPSGRRVLSFGPTISTWADWNHRGERQDWYVEPGVEILLAGPVALHVSRVERNEVFQNLAFRQHQTKVAIQDGRKGSLTFSGSISAGTSVNYQPREGRPPAPASSHEESISVSWRPEPRLRVDEIAFFTRLSQAEGRVFDNTLSRTRVNFQFTRRLSARGIVDYAAVTPDPALARQPLSRQLTSDLLVTYLVDPFTALYVGYSDLRENVDVVASPVRHLTTPAGLTMSTGRQVFVKVTIGMRF